MPLFIGTSEKINIGHPAEVREKIANGRFVVLESKPTDENFETTPILNGKTIRI